jgi:glutathione S-transferase
MYTLYYSPGSCSLTVHALLRELGVPFTLAKVGIPDGAHRTPEYLALNPRGRVPTLVVDGVPVHESLAIINLLIARHPGQAPAPAAGTLQRAGMDAWLAFGASNFHAQLWAQYFRGARFVTDAGLHPVLKAEAETRLIEELGRIDAHLAGREYLLGEQFTVADLAFFTYGRWGRLLSTPTMAFPHYKAFMERLASRPALAAALSAEGIGTFS